MRGIAEKKVEGGKLLRLKVDYNGTITRIQLTGDFFVHPEDSLFAIEEKLKGLSIQAKEEDIMSFIEDIVQKNDIQLIGITPGAIAQTLKEALKK